MTDPVVTSIANPPPRKARKPKAAKSAPAPKAPRAPRATPARTLRRRVDDLGECFLEAFDRARKKGGDAYEKLVRDALDAADALKTAKARNDAARMALAEAANALIVAENVEFEAKPVLDRLALAAKTLAGLDGGDDTPTDADRIGVELPE